jgi:DNA-directed RNA polymerase delta subunit
MQELKNYVVEESTTTLKCIRLLSNIANKKGLLLNIKDIVYESINLIKTEDSEIRNAIQDIKDFYGRCGFTEFRD